MNFIYLICWGFSFAFLLYLECKRLVEEQKKKKKIRLDVFHMESAFFSFMLSFAGKKHTSDWKRNFDIFFFRKRFMVLLCYHILNQTARIRRFLNRRIFRFSVWNCNHSEKKYRSHNIFVYAYFCCGCNEYYGRYFG